MQLGLRNGAWQSGGGNLFKFPATIWTGTNEPTTAWIPDFGVTYPSAASNGYMFPTTSMPYTYFNVAGNATETEHDSGALANYGQMVCVKLKQGKQYRLTATCSNTTSTVWCQWIAKQSDGTYPWMTGSTSNYVNIYNVAGASIDKTFTATQSETGGVYVLRFLNGARTERRTFSNIILIEV